MAEGTGRGGISFTSSLPLLAIVVLSLQQTIQHVLLLIHASLLFFHALLIPYCSSVDSIPLLELAAT